jgi:riboflavin synthase
MSKLKDIPIVSAKAIAEENECDAVVVLGLRDGNYCLTSYGKDRTLCRAAKAIHNDIDALLQNGGLWVPFALRKGGRKNV